MRNDEVKNEIDEIKKQENKIKRKDFLLDNFAHFSKKSRPSSKEDKDKKQNTFCSVSALYEGRE